MAAVAAIRNGFVTLVDRIHAAREGLPVSWIDITPTRYAWHKIAAVDAANAAFTNSVGAAALSAWWQDPDFDAGESAFYYARVIQIPTPRWPAYDAKRLGHALMEGTQVEVQDRAYTSPIWYTP